MAFDIREEYSLAEVLAENNPQGGIYTAYDLLKNTKRSLFREAMWVESTDPTVHYGHKWSERPSAEAVRYNTGAGFKAATMVPYREELMRMEMNMKLDTRMVKKSNNAAKFRVAHERQHFEGFMDSFMRVTFTKADPVSGVVQGSRAVNPIHIDGLGARRAKTGTNCISAGGSSSGSMGSIWIIKHGLEHFHFLYPKGGESLLQEQDMTPSKPEMVEDENGNPYWVWLTNWAWEFGLEIVQDESVKRICNIPASGDGSIHDSTDEYKLEDILDDALAGLPDGDTSNTGIYVPQALVAQFTKRANRKREGNFMWSDLWGTPSLYYREVPILVESVLKMDEATVTA